MKTAIITSESSEKHITGDGHPEQPKRVVSIIDTLKKNKELLWDKPDVVPNDILNMTHSEDYINNLKDSFPKSGLIQLYRLEVRMQYFKLQDQL